MLVRRLLLICTASSMVMALVVGIFILWAVVVDYYPVVPAEGFSLGRKTVEVATGTLYGAPLGLATGVLVFLLSLGRDALKRRREFRARRGNAESM